MGSKLYRLLPEPLFTWSKTFFSRLVGIRQDFLVKDVLMTAQRDFRFGNSLFAFDIFRDQTLTFDPITSSLNYSN